MVFRVPGEVEYQVTLFDRYFTKKSTLQVFQACHGFIFMYYSKTSTACVIYLGVAWEQGFQSPGIKLCSF